MPDSVRQPAVAGQFYRASREALLRELEQAYTDARGPGALPIVNPDGPRRLLGLVSPHAGYMFSGAIAAYGFSALAADGIPDTFVLIGPNHRWGRWQPAIQTSGSWLTPLGEAPIDEPLAEALAAALPEFSTNASLFEGEHSLEVQLPFLQHLYGEDFRFVPIMMLQQDQAEAAAIAAALEQVLTGRNGVILASTDMTHQEPRAIASAQDKLLIERILALDPDGLLLEQSKRDITMCGYGPTAAMLMATKALGATRAEVLRYGDSGEVHPATGVVGYLSAAVYR